MPVYQGLAKHFCRVTVTILETVDHKICVTTICSCSAKVVAGNI